MDEVDLEMDEIDLEMDGHESDNEFESEKSSSDCYEEYDTDEYDDFWAYDGPLRAFYDSDEFAFDSEGEEMKEHVAHSHDFELRYGLIPRKEITVKFGKWELLPLELKEMIADMLEFPDWLNLMAASGDNKGYVHCVYFPFRIKHFSFYSDVIQEGSKEMEHIRIRMNDDRDPSMVNITEYDGYCKFSWNSDHAFLGSVKVSYCGYLRVVERFIKNLLINRCKSFKFVVLKNKTDPSALSVSNWPYFHKFVKSCIGFPDYGRNLVDDQFIVDSVYLKTTTPVIDIVNSMINVTELMRKRVKCVLTLPNLDAKKVVDTINEQLSVMFENRKPGETDENEKDVKFLYGCYDVARVSDNTLQIEGPVSDYEYIYNNFFSNDGAYEGDVEQVD